MPLTEASRTRLKDGLHKLIIALIGISERWRVVEETALVLLEVTGGRPVVERNPAILRLLLDSFSLCAIDLASWRKALLKFVDLMEGNASGLSVQSEKRVQRDRRKEESSRRAAAVANDRRIAFAHLFPEACSERRFAPKQADFQSLRHRISDLLKPVKEPRDGILAHRFDELLRHEEVQPDELLLSTVSYGIECCKWLLSTIGVFLFETSIGFEWKRPVEHADEVAHDLADLLLYGTIADVLRRAQWCDDPSLPETARKNARAKLRKHVETLDHADTVDTADLWAPE